VLNWNIEEITLDLKYTWKISRNESNQKINSFVSVSQDGTKGMGEVAPNIRYGESLELVSKQFRLFLTKNPSQIKDLTDLTHTLNTLDLCPSLRFGIESAYIHYLSKKSNKKVYEQLGLPSPGEIFTSYTLPIMEVGLIKGFIDNYNLKRFKTLKIKINSTEGLETIKEVSRCTSQPLRVDANESWKDVENLIEDLNKLKGYNIEFWEQPMPSNQVDEYIYLKKYTPFELIADESITNEGDFTILAQQFHGVNMKLMKAGGYLNGIRILNEARKNGLKTMIGCMVETTLGISSAMNICNNIDYIDLDGFFIINNEPYKLAAEDSGGLYFLN
jgi:L-alanine-DL-glutamate epimerase-like enolase superfamily enzyme